MKKVLILLFAVTVLVGCITDPELGRIDKWEGFPPDSRSYTPYNFWSSVMFETLTGISAGTVKTSERVLIERERDTYSLVRITGAKVTYVLTVLLMGDYNRVSITLVIDGRVVMLKTVSEQVGSEVAFELVMAEVPPENVEELFASDDIRIIWLGKTIKLTEKEIGYLRMLTPQKPQ